MAVKEAQEFFPGCARREACEIDGDQGSACDVFAASGNRPVPAQAGDGLAACLSRGRLDRDRLARHHGGRGSQRLSGGGSAEPVCWRQEGQLSRPRSGAEWVDAAVWLNYCDDFNYFGSNPVLPRCRSKETSPGNTILSTCLRSRPTTVVLDNDRADRGRADDDRRRSVRFVCGGHAKISLLPSDGIFVPGMIRDLSLHGCCIDSTLPIDYGTRAEIVLRVNAASFRAVGEVKAIRGRSAAGMEFLQLSTGGKELLADLVTDLARVQAVMNKLKSVRRETDAASFRKQLKEGKRQAAMLSARFPFLGTIRQQRVQKRV